MKRAFDIVIATIAVVLLSPILVGVTLFVLLKIGHPALFVQQRAGRYGRPFKIYKFRTMTNAVDASGSLLPDVDRLPAAGKFLRSTSLDELPELWNIIKGDMSLVGPRPLLMRYLPRYTAQQARRHDVRPGLTGYAQVNGRNSLSWEQRLALDIWYVDNRSFLLDFKILVMTVVKIFDRSGINGAGDATMSEFLGADIAPRAAADRVAGDGRDESAN
jgi:lipopolysaccharide/colanic/teichoic acid biosynthesis glycosyltransferase